jgi:hypothetical protein
VSSIAHAAPFAICCPSMSAGSASKRRRGSRELGAATRDLRRRQARPRQPSFIEDQHRWKLSLLRSFYAKRGPDALRPKTVVAPGVRLGAWVIYRRMAYRRGEMAPWLRDEFEKIPGWSWNAPRTERWLRRLRVLKTYVRRFGWDSMTLGTRFRGEDIGRWVADLRHDYRRGNISSDVVSRVEEIPGWSWTPREDRNRRFLSLLAQYLKVMTLDELVALGRWITNRRERRGRLHPAMISACETIPGWTWRRR